MTHLRLSSVELSKRWDLSLGWKGRRHDSRGLLYAAGLRVMLQMPVSSFTWENPGKRRFYFF